MWGSGERQRYIERRVRETERQGEAETEREETEIYREAERDREEEREREKKIRGKRCGERERDRDTEAGYRLEPLSWRKGLSEAPFRCAWSSPSLDEGTVRHQGVWKNVKQHRQLITSTTHLTQELLINMQYSDGSRSFAK